MCSVDGTTEEILDTKENDSSSKITKSGCSCSIPKRFMLLFMVFLGFVIMYSLRVNLNVAIGAMVNNHTVLVNGRAVEKKAEFNWDSKLQGIILGSLYYGYPILQLPSGWLSLTVGGTRIFGLGVFLASILTILTAPAARLSVYALIAVRAGEGLFLGVLAPCNNTIWSKWSHPMERTTIVAIAFSGCSVGTIITMPLTGLLTKYGFDGGWPSVFYCFGGFGVLWFFAWMMIAHECPSSHPSISKEEKDFLQDGIGPVPECKGVPWRSVITSKHVWAIVAANVSLDWGLYTLLICFPTFLLDILHFDIQAASFIAALPFVARSISMPVAGLLSDILRRNGVRTKTVRRLCLGTGASVSAISMLIAGYCTSAVGVIVSMCLSVGFSGLVSAAYDVNMLDIAPRFAGVLMGISNTFGTLSGFLSPMVVGFLTQNKKASEWQIVFWIAAGVYLLGALLFCTFLDDQQQPWASDVHSLKETVDISTEDGLGESKTPENESLERTSESELPS